ncbi:MAG: dihydropteroate synthase [Rhodospirillales bacterium]|nr:dihydropteroate synthase [Rhodospirillales bacterium]
MRPRLGAAADPVRSLYLRPIFGDDAGRTPRETCEVIIRSAGTVGVRRFTTSVAEALDWARSQGRDAHARVKALAGRLRRPPERFAGLALDRPLIMGVINVTPDSFSDGGETYSPETAIARGRAHVEAGADILDIGGESTRPGGSPVPEDEELDRVLPVVRGLAETGAAISVDTRRAGVMTAALDAGATIINDVTALRGDAGAMAIAAERKAWVVLMHMRGEPRTMQDDPRYDDARLDVYDFLEERVSACEAAGIGRDRIAVDPGIGFGKTVDHNLEILEGLGIYRAIGCPVVIGVSRKSFIAKLSAEESPDRRLAGSVAAALAAVARGAHVVRVHDVRETRQALAVWTAIAAGTAARSAT